MDLLLVNKEKKSHYVYIKDFNRFMLNKTNIKLKHTFADIVYNVLLMKESCKNIKIYVKKIHGKQSLKFESGTIKFKNYFKKIAVPFKIYANFESLFKK